MSHRLMMLCGRLASTARKLAASALVLAGTACAAAEARPAGTVVYASGADLESANPLVTIHPLALQIQRYALYVTLARYDDSLQPVPYYARSWRWSADSTRLTFTLASGLRWQDGVPTTARDVAFTLDAARDPTTGYPRYADLAGIESVTAADDSTVVIRFSRPATHFPLVLCELPIAPEHLLRGVQRARMREAPFNVKPVGNGPFRFVERRAGQRWVFERNGDFPATLGGPPTLERLVIAVVDEAATKFAGLVSGELDVAGISPTMARLVANDASLRVLDYPTLSSSAIIFNTARPPFDDVRVRRAIGVAIDRGRVIEAALAGYATPAAGPLPAGHPYAAPERPVLDTALADSLLDAAGWRRGANGLRERAGAQLRFDLLTVGSAGNAVEQLIQADLAAVGIRMEIRQREMASFLAEARARPKRFDALFTGIVGDVSLAYISAMYDSRLAGGALDYGGYHTPHLDSLLAGARTAPDGAAARDAWLAVQSELATQAPAVWVYHSRGVQGLSRRLHGVRMDLRGELVTLHDWSAAPGGASAASR
ncbi:MAG TPA: peptide ABC transporter substrate-binding protein [Gemmatimonadaceae bacterium]|nr:peptide ABC transporter substrate-binding protein [Gemmatimonadaceae bacterium]